MSTSLLNSSADRPLGRVRVATEVVGSIAAFAALEVEGVAGFCEPAGIPSLPLLLQHSHRGVRLQMVGDTGIKLELYLQVTPEASVASMAEELQERVGGALHDMLGLDALEINLHIAEIEER